MNGSWILYLQADLRAAPVAALRVVAAATQRGMQQSAAVPEADATQGGGATEANGRFTEIQQQVWQAMEARNPDQALALIAWVGWQSCQV